MQYRTLDTFNAERAALLVAAGLPDAAVNRIVDFMHEWETISLLSSDKIADDFILILIPWYNLKTIPGDQYGMYYHIYYHFFWYY